MARITFDFTEQELGYVKDVLFGLQKQSDATNDAVVLYVASQLKAHKDQPFTSDAQVEELIKDYLQLCADNIMVEDDELFVALVAGKTSLANAKEYKPHYISVEPISDTSPKRKFRVKLMGEEDAIEDNSYSTDIQSVIERPVVGADSGIDPNADFATRARQIKDAILPLVPDGVKTEIPDNEYAQALCCAEYYYNL